MCFVDLTFKFFGKYSNRNGFVGNEKEKKIVKTHAQKTVRYGLVENRFETIDVYDSTV